MKFWLNVNSTVFLSALVALGVSFVGFSAAAKLSIPTNLSSQDRQTALESLGSGTSAKLLGDPFPLGGYSGVELGITTEVVPTSDLARLGAKTAQQSETSYSVLTIGKGLYYNVDVFGQFGFMSSSENISNYGGQLRWNFYQAEYLPVFLSFVLSGSSTNFQNLIITNNQGMDLIAGVNVDDVTLYLGTGQLQVQGTFIGGASGITDTSDTMKEGMSTNHYMAGINLKFSQMFLAMQIDRYSQSTYSAKLGVRF